MDPIEIVLFMSTSAGHVYPCSLMRYFPGRFLAHVSARIDYRTFRP
jgi:hypothetical protein